MGSQKRWQRCHCMHSVLAPRVRIVIRSRLQLSRTIQYAALLRLMLRVQPHIQRTPSNPVLRTRWALQHHHNHLHQAQSGPQINGARYSPLTADDDNNSSQLFPPKSQRFSLMLFPNRSNSWSWVSSRRCSIPRSFEKVEVDLQHMQYTELNHHLIYHAREYDFCPPSLGAWLLKGSDYRL